MLSVLSPEGDVSNIAMSQLWFFLFCVNSVQFSSDQKVEQIAILCIWSLWSPSAQAGTRRSIRHTSFSTEQRFHPLHLRSSPPAPPATQCTNESNLTWDLPTRCNKNQHSECGGHSLAVATDKVHENHKQHWWEAVAVHNTHQNNVLDLCFLQTQPCL